MSNFFDTLISKENKIPKENMEYVYILDIIWKPNSFGSIKIVPGKIITNVVRLENNGYEFILKETGEKYCTNYGWSLMENTPENHEAFKVLNIGKQKLEAFKKEVNLLHKKIKTLE